MWQSIFVGILVSGALAYIVHRLYKQFFAKEEACEGCAVRKTMESN